MLLKRLLIMTILLFWLGGLLAQEKTQTIGFLSLDIPESFSVSQEGSLVKIANSAKSIVIKVAYSSKEDLVESETDVYELMIIS